MDIYDGKCLFCGEAILVMASDGDEADILATAVCTCERTEEHERLLSELPVPKTGEVAEKEEVERVEG